MILKTHTKKQKSSTVDSIVIFLHGFGANGNDLLSLADPLGEYLQNTLFLSPDAPHQCSINPLGYEWFPIPYLDHSNPINAGIIRAQSIDTFNTYLDEVSKIYNISSNRIILLGFSQGAMMSLHIAPRRRQKIGGTIAISGQLLDASALAQEAIQKPPVLLIHGDMDDVVPYDEMANAKSALEHAGISVESHTSKGVGHTIAPDGLNAALNFMHAILNK